MTAVGTQVYFNHLSVVIIILPSNLSEKFVSTYPILPLGIACGES
jgi:hypothetical protein